MPPRRRMAVLVVALVTAACGPSGSPASPWARPPPRRLARPVPSFRPVGRGTFVAAGERVGGGDAAVWNSTDGLAWTDIEDESFAGASIVRIVAGGLGFVAVGTRNQNDAAIWTSADGTEWEPVPPAPVLTDA
jgi:hypothetical protein